MKRNNESSILDQVFHPHCQMRIPSFIIPLVIATAGFCYGHAQSFTNADFEAGNTGFSSGYQFANANSDEGQFTVRSDPQNWNQEFVNFGDHTTGTGRMLVVNGATSGNPAVWRQTIATEPNTSYRFNAWVGTAVAGGPANLLLMIDGFQIGPSFVLPDGTGSWALWDRPWRSSASAAHTFEIVNANTSRFPNDFYMDDIVLLKAPLELGARVAGGDFELRWPADSAWGLFTSRSLLAGSWNAVTNSPTANGVVNILRLPMDAPRAFFRLQRIP